MCAEMVEILFVTTSLFMTLGRRNNLPNKQYFLLGTYTYYLVIFVLLVIFHSSALFFDFTHNYNI